MGFKSFNRNGHNKSKAYFAKETRTKPSEYEIAQRRQYTKNAIQEYVNPTQYVEFKLKMLREEMYINPTEEEVAHLMELKSELAIDRAVHTIIDRHWK
jgi:hypothetical protein